MDCVFKGPPSWVPTFIRNVSLIVRMLLSAVFVHMESRWRHVSVSCKVAKGEGHCVG